MVNKKKVVNGKGFTKKELDSIRGPFSLPVERDTFFKPTLLSKIKEGR